MLVDYVVMIRAPAFIPAIASLVLSVTCGTGYGQKYELTKLHTLSRPGIFLAAPVVYAGHLYYAIGDGLSTATLVRSDGLATQEVFSFPYNRGVSPAVSLTSGVADGLLISPSGAPQYVVNGLDWTQLKAADASIELTSTAYVGELGGKHYYAGWHANGGGYFRREADGLMLIQEVNGHDYSPDGRSWTKFGEELILAADGPNGNELYRSDGYSLELIDDIRPGPGDSDPGRIGFPTGFYHFNQELYFDASGPAERELYKYDGTDVTQVADINPGNVGSSPNYGVVFNDLLIVSATGPNGVEPYAVDANGARLLADIVTNGHSFPEFFTEFEDWLYFEAANDLYRTDGIAVERINGIARPELRQAFLQGSPTTYRGRFYVAAQGDQGRGIYSTDGETFALVPGTDNRVSFPAPTFHEFAGDLFISFNEGDGAELYRWDGDSFSQFHEFAAGCTLDNNVCYPKGGSPRGFVRLGNSLFLLANGDDDQALYRIDLTIDPGDYNADGSIDLLDHQMWVAAFGQEGFGLAADGNFDGVIDAADYTVWRDAFFATAAVGAGVPEPTGMLLALTAAAVFVCFERRMPATGLQRSVRPPDD